MEKKITKKDISNNADNLPERIKSPNIKETKLADKNQNVNLFFCNLIKFSL